MKWIVPPPWTSRSIATRPFSVIESVLACAFYPAAVLQMCLQMIIFISSSSQVRLQFVISSISGGLSRFCGKFANIGGKTSVTKPLPNLYEPTSAVWSVYWLTRQHLQITDLGGTVTRPDSAICANLVMLVGAPFSFQGYAKLTKPHGVISSCGEFRIRQRPRPVVTHLERPVARECETRLWCT